MSTNRFSSRYCRKYVFIGCVALLSVSTVLVRHWSVAVECCAIEVIIWNRSTLLWYPESKSAKYITLPVADVEDIKPKQNRIHSNSDEAFPDKRHVGLFHMEDEQLSITLQDYNKRFDKSKEEPPRYKHRPRGKVDASAEEIICRFKEKVPISFVGPNDSPFHELGIGRIFPESPLFPWNSTKSKYKTCAVVMTSATLKGSRLGNEIDAHEAVLRFNYAPTKGYEKDVGNKTTLRVVNNRVVFESKFAEEMGITGEYLPLVSWREGPYNANMYKWYRDGKSVFCQYVKWYYKYPFLPIHMLRFETIWQLWDVVQEFTTEELNAIPLSSGSVGIFLMMSICETVDVYGFVSRKDESYCYYYKDCPEGITLREKNHPIDAERNLLGRLHQGDEQDIVEKHKVTVKGYSAYKCKK